MNGRAKMFLKAAEILDINRAVRMAYFYTALAEAGSTMEDDNFAFEYTSDEGVPVAHIDERILACCFLAAIAELGE